MMNAPAAQVTDNSKPVKLVPTSRTVNRLPAKRRRATWVSQAQQGAIEVMQDEIDAPDKYDDVPYRS
jgi:hypothetical protein